MRKQHSNARPFPAMTKQKALEIATQVCKTDSKEFRCHSKKPKDYRIYRAFPDEPCWFVTAAWDDAPYVLRSSRLIVISRITGKVFYDGSAGDEG